MAFFSRARHTTRHLTHAPVVLSVRRAPRRRRPLWLLCLLLIAAGTLWFADAWPPQWPWLPQWAQAAMEPPRGKSVQQWQQEVAQLQQEVERLQMAQQIERATRQELERNIAALQEQLKAAALERDFVKSSQTPREAPK